MSILYIKKTSMSRIDLIGTAGLTLKEVRELDSSESYGIHNVVALDVETPEGWTTIAKADRKSGYYQPVPYNLSSAIGEDGYQTRIMFVLMDEHKRERVSCGFPHANRNSSYLSIMPEWDIHNQVFSRSGEKLPPQLAHWGVLIRDATPQEIELYNGNWLKINRYGN